MKTLLITFALTLSTLLCKAQVREGDRIYWSALERYTVAVDSFYAKYSDAFKLKEIFLEKPVFVDSIPFFVNGYRITLITPQNKYALYKTHSNKLLHTIMSPLTIQDSSLYISFTPYHGELSKGRNYKLAVSDWTIVYFRYDLDKKKFIAYRVENNGI